MRPAARSLLKRTGLSTLLVCDLHNIRYLTDCVLSYGLLLVCAGRYRLFVDGRYTEEATRTARRDVSVFPLNDLPRFFPEKGKIGFEADTLTVASLKRWEKKFNRLTWKPTSGVVETFRRQKSAEEIRFLRTAERKTRALLRAVPSLLRPGITETQLAWALRTRAAESGAADVSFDPIVAFAEHTSRPHHHPTTRCLKKGDMVQIDIGVRYRGYCGDLSDVFFTAPKTTEQRTMYGALKEAKKAAIDLVRPGVDVAVLDRAARAVLARHDLEKYFTHALGHGVGLDIHEGATISTKAKGQNLLRNEVVTIEPGAYIPGKFGMRLEDMVVVE